MVKCHPISHLPSLVVCLTRSMADTRVCVFPPPSVSKTSSDAGFNRIIASSKAGLIIVPEAFHLLSPLPCFVFDGVRTLLELILICAIFLLFSSPYFFKLSLASP